MKLFGVQFLYEWTLKMTNNRGINCSYRAIELSINLIIIFIFTIIIIHMKWYIYYIVIPSFISQRQKFRIIE